MRKKLDRRSLLVCAVVGVLAGVWAWQQRAIDTALTAEDALSRIPAVADPSPTDKAVANWVSSVRRDRRNADAWAKLGEALMQKSRDTMDLTYYSRAEVAFREALALDSANVFALNGLAWVAGSRHDFAQSVEWANRTIAIDPMNHDAYGLLGDAALEMGNYEMAFQHYQKMMDIRPDLASYSRGAQILYLTGDTRRATWLMQKAIAAGAPYAENTIWSRAQLALMLWNTGALLPAWQNLEAALQQAPNNYHLLVASAKVKASNKDYDAAVDFYQRAIAVAPQHEAIVGLGDIYRLMGRETEAGNQYRLVEEIHRLNQANGVLGDLQMARFYADHDKNLPEALQIAEEQFQKTPNVYAADTLAWCYYKVGRYEDAKAAIAKALRHGTPDASFLFHAGMIYAKLNDDRTARQYLYRALSLNSMFHPVYGEVAASTLQSLGSVSPKTSGR
jgi:tetratricopeptide (TPR) repeat protein